MVVLSLRHFSPVEFRCKCGCGAGMEKMDADLLQMLDEAHESGGHPVPPFFRVPLPEAQQGGRRRAHVSGYSRAMP